MEFETLSSGKFRFWKKFFVGVMGFFLVLFGIFLFHKSYAKYRVTQSIQIVNGTVQYTNADFSMLGVKVQSAKGSGTYVSASGNKVPESGYKLKSLGTGETDSYCTINGTKNNTGINITYANGSVTFSGIKEQGTRCYLFFDLQTDPSGSELLTKFKGTMGSGTPDFSKTACSNGCGQTTNGLYKTTDSDSKETYYFRGTVANNWVKMGNFYWRIIRFNGNGSIRLIYSGTGTPAETGAGTQLDSTGTAFNSSYSDARYVKFVYGSTSSTIKQKLDSWYTSNLTSFASKLDGSAGFCNDGDESTTTSTTYFPPYNRLYSSKAPSLACSKTNLFTTKGNTNGNEKLTNAIGLITADEVALAGGVYGTANSGYYLYTNQYYWTMSPYYFTSGGAGVFYVFNYGYLTRNYVNSALGVRPVINLRADTLFKEGGDGSKTKPYEVI